MQKFSNRAIYLGPFKNGIGHGKGVIKYKNGYYHDIEYNNGKMVKKGPCYNAHGDKFNIGCTNGNCKNGKGTFAWANGEKYKGQFEN